MLKYAAAVLGLPALIAVTPAQAGEPPQAWASTSGLVSPQPNGIKLDHDDVLDRLHIQEAFARWGIGYDEGRSDVIASLFTADAVFQVTEGSKQPIDWSNGRDAIVTSVAAAFHKQADQRRHAISNIVIDKLTADRATAIAYGVVVVANNGLILNATVIYSADLRREADGVWRFSRFVVGMDKYVGEKPHTPQ